MQRKRGAREVSYRIAVAELAPLAAPGATAPTQIKILTGVSVWRDGAAPPERAPTWLLHALA